MKSILLKAYSRLLADLGKQTNNPLFEERHLMSEEWLLIEAPKLDKLMWRIFEDLANPQVDAIDVEFMAKTRGIDISHPLFTRFDVWVEDVMFDFVTNKKDITRELKAAHQMLVFCYKAEHEPTESQLEDAYRVFEENDEAVSVWDLYYQNTGSRSPLSRIARSLIGKVIYQAKWDEIAPQHGPGSVYPSKFPWEKSGFLTYYPSIDRVYSYSDWLIGMPNYWSILKESVWEKRHEEIKDDLMVDSELSEEMVTSAKKCPEYSDEIVCRIQAVPKDSRGPRLICVHPSEAIWIQQGTRHVLEKAIENSPLTRKVIHFRDQSVNGQLALSSSLDKTFCTLDLKDASDRLSNLAVRELFGEHAYRYLGCSRATSVRIGDRVQTLNKFAPMGNALTFPVQSLVYWAVVRAGIQCTHGDICEDVYVFGDDILFPSKYYRGAINALTRFGLITNTDKTFMHGSFRESCGVDAWNGIDITPLRLKVININSSSKAIATCDLARRARLHGCYSLAAYLYSEVSKRFGPLAKTNNLESQGLVEYEDVGWDKLLFIEKRMRFSRNLHRWEVPTKLAKQSLKRLRKHEWFHVQDSLVRLWREYDHCAYSPLELITRFRGYNPSEHYRAIVDYSDRGTEYPMLHGVRLQCSWTEVIMK